MDTSACIEQVFHAPDVFLVQVPFENISTSATNCYVIMDRRRGARGGYRRAFR